MLCSQDFNEALISDATNGTGICTCQMAIEGGGVELGHDVDLVNAAVNAVADGDVNEAIIATQRHSGLGTLLRERV